MTDIFNEVDQDLRREQLKALWNRFGIAVIAAAVLIVVFTAGFRGWQYWSETRAAAAGDRYLAALALADAGKDDEAAAAFEAIAADGSGAYPALAAIRAAAAEAGAGNRDAALARYQAVADSSATPDLLRDIARLRAAMIEVDTLSFADFQARIATLADGGSPFRYTARELLGLSAWRTGDLPAARTYFQGLVDEANTPNALRQRGQEMLSLIQGRIGPAPTPAPADAAAPAEGAAAPTP